jgi:hypothetical protein
MTVGCGRVGYDPSVHGRSETGDGDQRDTAVDRSGVADSEPTRPEPAPDAPVADVVLDLTADAAPPVDMIPPDIAVPPDMARPPDTAADMADTGPAVLPCQSFPANDLIADFESGTLVTNRVGARGGSTFHLVNDVLGSLSNVALPYCGQRAMRIVASSPPPGSPVAQGRFMFGSGEYFDARAYQGVTLAFRASTPIFIRVKLPNQDTFEGGNDHFQLAISVGTTWNQASFSFAAFKQVGTATQFPRFDLSRLGAIEISASLPVGGSLWVDEIAFVR